MPDQDRKVAAFESYLSHLNFKLLSWLLQRFGNIQSKNKDTKSAVRIFLKIEKCDWFLTCHMAVIASKGLTAVGACEEYPSQKESLQHFFPSIIITPLANSSSSLQPSLALL